MKKIVLFFISFLWLNIGQTDENIAYININKILSDSKVGKFISAHIINLENQKINYFKEIENKFSDEEKKIIAKKNILNQNDFINEFNLFKDKVSRHNESKKNFYDELKKKKIKYTNEILKNLNPIISDYVEKNNISILLSNENIIVAKRNLDITNKIIDLLNTNITKIVLDD